MTNYAPVTYKFVSTKEYIDEFPVAYKQWRADTHCSKLHGYSYSIKLYFGANDLDKRGWVVDFGGLKELKAILQEQFDHRTIIAQDDPELDHFKQMEQDGLLKLTVVPAMGCEALADMLYKYINAVYIPDYLGAGEAERLWCWRVEVRETAYNMAWREGHRCWNEDLLG
jgi:6-pyruvoyltetrahydropterin/6-carboxytetrahydropterin synthase